MSMSSMNPSSMCDHDFIEVDDKKSLFRCGACKTAIAGKRFSCTSCGFALHPFCKASPLSLRSSSLHSEHTLALVATPAYRKCDVCFDLIEGTHYTCHFDRRCDFHVHPICTQVCPRVHHVLDQHHSLELLRRPPLTTRCNVCHEDCHGWGYRCGACAIDIHFWCLLKPSSGAGSGQQPAPSLPVAATRSVRGPDRDPNYYGFSRAPSHPVYFGLVNYENIGFDMSCLRPPGSYSDGTMTTTRGPALDLFMRFVGSLAMNLLVGFIIGGTG